MILSPQRCAADLFIVAYRVQFCNSLGQGLRIPGWHAIINSAQTTHSVNPQFNNLENVLAQIIEHAAEYVLDRELSDEELNAAVLQISAKAEDALTELVGELMEDM